MPWRAVKQLSPFYNTLSNMQKNVSSKNTKNNFSLKIEKGYFLLTDTNENFAQKVTFF